MALDKGNASTGAAPDTQTATTSHSNIMEDAALASARIYVGGLNAKIKEEHLTAEFSKYGEIVSSK